MLLWSRALGSLASRRCTAWLMAYFRGASGGPGKDRAGLRHNPFPGQAFIQEIFQDFGKT